MLGSRSAARTLPGKGFCLDHATQTCPLPLNDFKDQLRSTRLLVQAHMRSLLGYGSCAASEFHHFVAPLLSNSLNGFPSGCGSFSFSKLAMEGARSIIRARGSFAPLRTPGP